MEGALRKTSLEPARCADCADCGKGCVVSELGEGGGGIWLVTGKIKKRGIIQICIFSFLG